MLEGIDISTYQTTTPSLSGLSFVFARASYGTSPDIRYAQHAADVRAAGLVLGAYHYWQLADPASQVATFLAAAKGADLLAIDLEGAGSGTDTAHAQVTDMIARLAAAGRACGLYHSLSGYPELGQSFRWVAAWGSTPPPIPYTFWQYQGAPLDRDRYAGTLAELKALAEGGMYAIDTRAPLGSPNPRAFTIPGGVTVHGYDPARPNTVVATYGPATAPATWHADAIDAITWYGTPTQQTPHGYPFLHVTDGPLAGLLIQAGLVQLAPADPPGPTAADLAAATAAGFADAKSKALAAVSGI